MTKNIINIGLPSKGRLKHDTINIFKKKKLNIYSERGERDLFGHIKKLPNVKIIYLHARECIEQLSLGNIDVGFSGIDLLKENGLQPRNIDFVVVCEQPKIGPYVDQLKKSLSGILNIEESFIGVKATTTEKMGIIGDGNGIAVYAIASLRDLE